MSRKNNLYLPILILALFLVFGCNLLNSKKTNVQTTNVNTASPSPSKTPTYEENLMTFRSQDDELGKFTAPDKIDPKAKIKGKVAIVEGEDSSYSFEGLSVGSTNDETLKEYGLTKDDMAVTIEELDTLVQTNCSKGRKIGSYRITDGRIIPAYELKCETLVFDYKAPAVVARKTFYGRDLSENIEVTSATTERTAYIPTEQIKKYVKSLRSK